MGVRKSKIDSRFYIIDGVVLIDGQRFRYHKQDLNDKNFMSKKWCQEYEQRIRQEILDKNQSKDEFKKLSIKGLVEAYIEKIKTDGYRESTIQSLNYKIDLYIYSFFGKTILVHEAFKVSKCVEFRNFVGSFNMTANYKNKILALLKQLINYAAVIKVITYNTERDCNNVLQSIRNNDQKKIIHSYTSFEDATKVWENASSDFYKNVIKFFYFSGCRISEFLAIMKKDIFFNTTDNNTFCAEVSINKQVSKTKGEILPYLKTSTSYRKIRYYGDVALALYEYIERNDFDDDDIVFNISKTTFRRELTKAFDKAGVQRNTFHGFGRKSIATYLYKYSKDAKLAQIYLGHKKVDMTMNTYVLNEALEGNLDIILEEIEKK